MLGVWFQITFMQAFGAKFGSDQIATDVYELGLSYLFLK